LTRSVNGPSRLELNLEPTAHTARHALLHMASKWSSHRTTRAGLRNAYCDKKNTGTYCQTAKSRRSDSPEPRYRSPERKWRTDSQWDSAQFNPSCWLKHHYIERERTSRVYRV